MSINAIGHPVETIKPRNNEEEVSLDTNITINFTNYMEESSVLDPERIHFSSGNKTIPSSRYYDRVKKELIITPSKPLEPGEIYRIHIKSMGDGPYTIEKRMVIRDWYYHFTTEWTETAPEDPNIDDPGIDEPNPEEPPEETEEPPEVIIDPFEPGDETFALIDSYPEYGNLISPSEKMVFVFNKNLTESQVNKNIFIKEKKLSRLLEKLNEDKLIGGSATLDEQNDDQSSFVFEPNKTLSPGKEYELVIRKGIHESLSDDIRITFHTVFLRMFAEVDSVRLTLGRFSEGFTDLDLAKLINQQSNSIYQLASMMSTFDEAEWGEEGGVIITFPYAASQYVVYSTAYYAILGKSLETSSGMSESIKLADLSVSGSTDVSDSLGDLLEMLKKEMDRWWNVLQGEPEEIDPEKPNPNYSVSYGTRGAAQSPYPDYHTRVPFDEIGGGN